MRRDPGYVEPTCIEVLSRVSEAGSSDLGKQASRWGGTGKLSTEWGVVVPPQATSDLACTAISFPEQ